MAILPKDYGNLAGFRLTRNVHDERLLDVIVYPNDNTNGYVAATFMDDTDSGGCTAVQPAGMFLAYEVIPHLITQQN